MLQCSNYKTKAGAATFSLSRSAHYTNLYHAPNFPGARARNGRYRTMGQFAGARDLRNLMSVAAMLRLLADDTLCRGDSALYLMTAGALEKRAQCLADILPEENHAPVPSPMAHQPLDMKI